MGRVSGRGRGGGCGGRDLRVGCGLGRRLLEPESEVKWNGW